ncbi:MAG: hypothetical protein LUE24_11220 [Lachnospiraceae bacterium]|nr:hypothetical protein [Lachnospiraceae bacterium]
MFQLFLKNKKAIILTVAVPLLAVVLLVAGISLKNRGLTRFAADGSVYDISVEEDSTATVSQTYFSAGTALRRGVSSVVTFVSEDGETVQTGETSFIHYENGAITAVSGMLLIDLQNFPDGWMDSYYLDSLLALEHSGDVYTIENNTQELSFENFLLKTGDSDYLIVSPTITLSRAGGSENVIADGFLELHYLNDDTLALNATDGTEAWQFLAEDSTVTLENGVELNLSSLLLNSGVLDEDSGDYTALLALLDLAVSSDDAVKIESSSSSDWVAPTFIINAVDGEDGADGTDGRTGDTGEEGTAGADGATGADGEDGSDGSGGGTGGDGSAGSAGKDGENSDDDDSTLEETPYVNITSWTQTAGSVSFSLRVYNSALIQEGMTKAYILNVATGATLPLSPSSFDLSTFTDGEINEGFSCSDLQPGTKYRLVITAQVLLSDGSGNYAKSVLLSRTFTTDANGFYIEKVSSDYINDDNYNDYADQDINADYGACLGFMATLSGGQELSEITEGTLSWTDENGDAQSRALTDDELEGLAETAEDGSTYTFYGLLSNTEYTLSVTAKLVGGATSSYTDTFLTLKVTPVVTDAYFDVNANRYFISSATLVSDPDNAISYYSHEIYRWYDGSELTGDCLKRITSTDERVLVYTGGQINYGTDELGVSYQYGNRIYVVYYDNEKYVELEVEQSSSWSAQSIDDVSDSWIQFGGMSDDEYTITTNSIDGYLTLYTGSGRTIYVGDMDIHRILVQITSSAGYTKVLYYSDLTEWCRTANYSADNLVSSGTTSWQGYLSIPLELTGLSAETTYTITVTAYYNKDSGSSETVGSTIVVTKATDTTGD